MLVVVQTQVIPPLHRDDSDSDRPMTLCSVLAFALLILVLCASMYRQDKPSRSYNRRRARKEALEEHGSGLFKYSVGGLAGGGADGRSDRQRTVR